MTKEELIEYFKVSTNNSNGRVFYAMFRSENEKKENIEKKEFLPKAG